MMTFTMFVKPGNGRHATANTDDPYQHFHHSFTL